ncbi:EXS-domain-containing protein [Meredithblackwellia eburnea MCA 4105]
MFNPLPVLYPTARWWMIRSFTRVILAGLVRVEFRDFFLGDELNSLYYAVYNLGFMFCTYHHRWPANVASVCSTNSTWTSAILSALPAFWRLGQSVRRYLDSDGLIIHLLNAGKYSMSVAYFFAYFGWRIHGSVGGWRKSIWILFGVLNSCYVSSWDIYMDWSLLRRNSRHFLLRPELGFKEHTWIYYPAMVLDILLRFAWVWYIAPGGPSVPVRGFCLAVMEVGRRIMWNGIRVESEHIGNVDGYRVTRDVPLPYVIPEAPAERQDNLEEEIDRESSTRKSRFFSTLHRWHKGIVQDFAPITNMSLPILRSGSITADNSPQFPSTRRKDYSKRQTSTKHGHDSSTPASEDDDDDDAEAAYGISEAEEVIRERRRQEDSKGANKPKERMSPGSGIELDDSQLVEEMQRAEQMQVACEDEGGTAPTKNTL